MSVSKERALLKIELYRISNKFIHELREGQKNPDRVWKLIPKYTINKNETANNRPIYAKYYHQFIGIMSEEKTEYYLYFNATTNDANLEEEISNAGIEDLFEEFDFEKLLSVFQPHSEEDISKFIFPASNYLVVEITYTADYDYLNGGYDYDSYVDIIGYLNNNLEIQYFEKET